MKLRRILRISFHQLFAVRMVVWEQGERITVKGGLGGCIYECVGFEIDFTDVVGATTGEWYLAYNNSQAPCLTHWQLNTFVLNNATFTNWPLSTTANEQSPSYFAAPLKTREKPSCQLHSLAGEPQTKMASGAHAVSSLSGLTSYPQMNWVFFDEGRYRCGAFWPGGGGGEGAWLYVR
jgi:hypothetical protein